MKPYSRYRTTDSEWIGEIPDHWELQRLANFGEFLKGRGISKAELTETGLPAVIYGDLYTRYGPVIKEAERFIPEKLAKQSVPIQMGDLLFTGSGETALDIGRCAAYMSAEVAYAGGDLNIYRQDAHDSRFLSYCLNTPGADQEKARLSRGQIIVHIYQRELRELKFPCPPRDEQEAIVAFLDHQTGLIDELIEKNTKLLELLDDQRKAIINEAVTKGLDPKAPMKDSGVEWLGQVPESWRPVKIKYLFDFQSGATPSTKNPAYWNGSIPWVSSKDMKTKYIDRTEDYITEAGLANSSCSLIEPGSVIVVSRSGILQRTIPVAINRVPLVVNQDQKVLTPKGPCTAEFFYHHVKGNEPILLNEWIKAGATVESIEIGAFMDHAIHLPPLAEQEDIVNYLQERTNTLDEVKLRIEQQNALLTDYRQSLISEAVTGKIDLRAWVPAPQQTVEP